MHHTNSAVIPDCFRTKHVRLTATIRADGCKVYEVEGALFFASIAEFQQQLEPKDDPDHVEIDFRRTKLMDHSAIEAVNALAERYVRAGRHLKLRHLSQDCLDLLDKAKGMIELNYREDPHYRVAGDKLG